ncbi:MAG TPA: hypothetical protein VL175_20420 [Pirellulales bacterium]|nr:hypothetical protein [Pirellulales bacterium]
MIERKDALLITAAPPHPNQQRVQVARPHSTALTLGTLLLCVAASGASCPRIVQQYTAPIPRALPAGAPLVQIIDVINDNSARVQSVSSSRATISTPGFPSLSANLSFQRPRSFRLIAQTFIGRELDIGSNDELLWFWVKHAQPPALFYCRHDQFAASAARQVMPVEPEWLIEAFGVVTFNPADQIEGPSPVGKGRVRVRTRPRGPGGVSHVTIIDESTALILEEHVYDARDVRLATALLSKHVRDPASGAKLPRHVEIQWPTVNFEMTIDMADVQVNQLPADPRELFAKPSYPGYTEIDLAQPVAPIMPNAQGTPTAPAQVRY